MYICSTYKLKSFTVYNTYANFIFEILYAYFQLKCWRYYGAKMRTIDFLNKVRLSPRAVVALIILIANSFIWYMYAISILMEIVKFSLSTRFEILTFWSINFIGTVFFALIGAELANNKKRRYFFLFWILFGIFSSFVLLFYKLNKLLVYAASVLLGASFGLGMPASMAYYAYYTTPKNRSKLGGFTFFLIGVGAFLLNVIKVDDLSVDLLVLIILRSLSLIVFLIDDLFEETFTAIKRCSYHQVIGQRSFLLYFIPWMMFCLVNYTSLPIMVKFLGVNLFNFLTAIEGALIGIFAIIGGFLSDTIGRKHVVITGFVMMGLGYAFLGVFPESQFTIFFYTLADGVAWGMFHTVFVMTLWGDLAQDVSSEKYYALGGLPYLLSHFLQIVIGFYVAEMVLANTIFSFASFFLFLAVIPLMFAPETLPENALKERELRSYIEKAKKVKEKFAKN